MFQHGIKPALLIGERKYRQLLTLIKGQQYIVKEINLFNGGTRYIVARPEAEKQVDEVLATKDIYKIGVMLGYYPESCELFKNTRRSLQSSMLINFNGINFNTMGLVDEAINWCLNQYGEKILEHQDYISVKISVFSDNKFEDTEFQYKQSDLGNNLKVLVG